MDFRSYLLLLIFSSILYIAGGRDITTNLDSGKKIIQAKDVTSEFDCVDLYKQPAFSNPLLKNHKIQMNPSFPTDLERDEVSPFEKAHFGDGGEGCPPGKVPIHRYKYGHKDFHQFTETNPGQHFAAVKTVPGEYHGARAIIELYNPQVAYLQISAAYVWLQNGPPSELNNIQFGWAVDPKLYGDTKARLTAFWTADNYKSGCYNEQCQGFVQVHQYYRLGQDIGDTSIPGAKQYVIDLGVTQDQSTGHWWLLINGTEKVGYWPKELFNHLNNGAALIMYGGWTYNSPDGVSPPMGSGTWPTQDYKTSSFFAKLKTVNSIYQEHDIYFDRVYSDAGSQCYNVKYFYYQGENLEQTFSYGGPGGNSALCGT